MPLLFVVVDSAAGPFGAADAVCVVVALIPLPPCILMSSVFGTVLRDGTSFCLPLWHGSLGCHTCRPW